jgi:hypothetical protein
MGNMTINGHFGKTYLELPAVRAGLANEASD